MGRRIEWDKTKIRWFVGGKGGLIINPVRPQVDETAYSSHLDLSQEIAGRLETKVPFWLFVERVLRYSTASLSGEHHQQRGIEESRTEHDRPNKRAATNSK